MRRSLPVDISHPSLHHHPHPRRLSDGLVLAATLFSLKWQESQKEKISQKYFISNRRPPVLFPCLPTKQAEFGHEVKR
jgi:hypothetical protein